MMRQHIRAGAVIVGLIVALALAAAWLAPHDPLARASVARDGAGSPIGPPFPPGTPGHWLGSDRFGRDTLSRIMWGARPTLLLAGLVALLRLALGTLVGIGAGWSQGVAGRLARGALSLASALPVLLVALAVITLLGSERGLVVFILGLSLTGWSGTAHLVAAQVRVISRQPYIAAGRALGASGGRLLARHIPRQLSPLVGGLLAIELASTLTLVAGSGFLGYYIGGGAWIVLSGDANPVAARTSDAPEWGQMLAGALERSLDPWPLLLVGGMLLLTITGSNLLGSGLMASQPTPQLPGRGWRAIERMLLALAMVPRRAAAGAAVVAVLALAGGTWWCWPRPPAVRSIGAAPHVPGGHAWGMTGRDPAGSRDADLPPGGPTRFRSWLVGAPFLGDPLITADGVVIAASRAALHLLDGAGTLRELPVPRQPIAGPALGSDGSIILVDRAAVAWALDRAGQTRWRGATADRGEATSGPVVAGDGSILFTTVDRVQALAADGTARWSSDVLDGPSELLPRVVPDGALVLLQDRIIRLADGRALPQQFVEPAGEFRDPLLLVGADGSLARRVADQVEIWQLHDGAPVVVARRSWPSASATITFPTQAGISRGGIAWLLYGAGAGEARLVWLAADGSSAQQATGMRAAQVIAVAPDGAVLVCGQQRGAAACAVLERTGTRWREVLGVPGGVVGGAFAGARAVVLTDAGGLVVIEFAAAGP
jgi:peptide/nickel transport system permease protein